MSTNLIESKTQWNRQEYDAVLKEANLDMAREDFLIFFDAVFEVLLERSVMFDMQKAAEELQLT